MTGKCYYITTLADWQRHAARFVNSHFIALDPRAPDPLVADKDGFVGARHAVPGAAPPELSHVQTASAEKGPGQTYADTELSLMKSNDGSPQRSPGLSPGMACHAPTEENPAQMNADAKILVLIQADEGVHLSLEGDAAFEALPHPLAQKPISDAAQSALASHGVAPGATTFDAAEVVARVHPLLRHRVF